MMNLYVQDLLNDFEYKVKQGHYKKMDYQTWRSLNAQRSSPVEIQISKDLNSVDIWPEAEITLTVDGLDYVFDAWDRSFGEFLSEFMQIELNGKPFDTLSAATASASRSTNELLNSIQNTYSSVYSTDGWTATSSISSNFYEKQPTVEINEKGLKINGQLVNEMIDEALCNSISGKENDNMNLFKGFDFGSCENDNVKMSMYGLAVKNATGSWVSYDAKTKTVIDVDILNFDGGKYMYKMPVALKNVAIGDVVIHNRKPVFVTAVASEGDGRISAVDPAAGEEKIILLTRSPFGFDFVTKVVNLFEGFADGASKDSPFGNILPFILMNDSHNSNDLLPLLFMANGGKVDMSNPMMLYFLAKGNNGSSDALPLLFLANGSGLAYGRQDPQPQNT